MKALPCLFLLAFSASLAARSRPREALRVSIPPQAASRANPLASRPELTGGGGKLFRRNCVQCHGADALGRGHAANLRAKTIQSQQDGALFWILTNGNLGRGMPSFSALPELERWQLVLYLRTLNPKIATGR